MIDKKDELIELQKEVIARYEKLLEVQYQKEKIMQNMIDNLSAQLSLIHWLDDKK
jgi:hypothetical protein